MSAILPYAVRLAREKDISQLAEIEKEAFPTNWPATPFKRDLTRESISVLVVCLPPQDDDSSPDSSPEPAAGADHPEAWSASLRAYSTVRITGTPIEVRMST